MNWNDGYEGSYHGTIVDVPSWSDLGRIEIIDGSLTQTVTGLRQSADATIDRRFDEEVWLRFYLTARQGRNVERVPLFTGLATSPSRELDGRRENFSAECYSVLKPCDDIYLQRGWYVASGVSCETVLRELLGPTPAPKEFDLTTPVPALENAIVAEEDETCLTMCDKILAAIGWRLRITGYGTIKIAPKTTSEVASFSANGDDIIEPEITIARDWFSAPNVFRAISDDLVAVARDDTSDSPLSVSSRGREVWMQETNVDLGENESIADYAIRRLKEEQAVLRTVSYKRRYIPDVQVGDVVALHYPAQDLDGKFMITSQSTSFGFNCETSEEVQEL